MTVSAIPPVDAISGAASTPLAQPLPAPVATSFSSILLQGVDAANSKALDADAQVRAFVLDDSIPVHQVTFALEQARLSLELMVQVRSRLVDAYQQFMNMQL